MLDSKEKRLLRRFAFWHVQARKAARSNCGSCEGCEGGCGGGCGGCGGGCTSVCGGCVGCVP